MTNLLKLSANNKKIYYAELIVILALLTSLGALTIDLQLPALPLIIDFYGINESNKQQWVITAYMIGFALAQIFYGPISDSTGRKPVLQFGLVVYVVASVACIFAESYWMFLLGRAFQGVGAAAARIMVNAITRDFFEGNEMAKVTSLIMLIFIMVPVFAPSLGGFIIWLSNWSIIQYLFVAFGLIVLLWSWLRLPESLESSNKKELTWKRVRISFSAVISEPVSIVYAVVSGIIFSGFMAYLNSSEQIFSQFYNRKELFPVIFGGLALFFGLAAFINSKIVMRFGAFNVLYSSMILLAISNIVSVFLAYFYNGLPPLWLLIVSLGLVNIFIGLVYGNIMAIAMMPLGNVAGMGASVIGMISAMLAAGLGILISQQLTDNVFPIVLGFFLSSLLSFLLVHKYRKNVITLMSKHKQ